MTLINELLPLPVVPVAGAATDGQGGQCRAAGGSAGALAREDQLAVLDGGDGVIFAPQAAQEGDIALAALTDSWQGDRRQIGRYARGQAVAPSNPPRGVRRINPSCNTYR